MKEQELINLEFEIWNARAAPDCTFQAIASLQSEVKNNMEKVRFSGPSGKLLKRELVAIVDAYVHLRELIQVDYWNPITQNDVVVWVFNKSSFNGESHVPIDYGAHLYECAYRAKEILRYYQRFQVVSEMHLYEIPFHRIILKRRFQKNNLL